MNSPYQNMPMGFGKMNKVLKAFLLSFLTLLVVFIAITLYLHLAERAKLRREGLRVSAFITGKNEQVSGTRKSPKRTFYFDLDLFIENADTTLLSKSIKENKTFTEKIDALVHDSRKRMESINYKSYASVKITVSWESYDKYEVGDKIRVVHLKDDVKSAKLLEELE